jgi:hypothetical protein
MFAAELSGFFCRVSRFQGRGSRPAYRAVALAMDMTSVVNLRFTVLPQGALVRLYH